MPCLWFSLHDLPPDEPAFNIDTVFRRLVPDQFKDGLRGLGGIGGISADVSRQTLQSSSMRISQPTESLAYTNTFFQHHPLTGVPSFFVHPCLLGDALANFECTRENYLMVWLGLVGGCVGLWVPKEMAIEPGAVASKA